MKTTLLGIALVITSSVAFGDTDCPLHAQHTSMAECPMHMKNDAATAADGSTAHAMDVERRHDTLGVTHDTTQHAFRLFTDGAAIELRANNDADTAIITAIRDHIRMIRDQFTANDFSTPMFVHGKTPDGIEDVRALHDRIDFRYEALPTGARVRMVTTDARALAALHAFMRFQIAEHHTADDGKVEAKR